MKLAYGYLMSFLLMTAIASVICFAIITLAVVLPTFITWSLPVAHIQWLLLLRISVVCGALTGMWFVCADEGKEMAKDFAGLLK